MPYFQPPLATALPVCEHCAYNAGVVPFEWVTFPDGDRLHQQEGNWRWTPCPFPEPCSVCGGRSDRFPRASTPVNIVKETVIGSW